MTMRCDQAATNVGADQSAKGGKRPPASSAQRLIRACKDADFDFKISDFRVKVESEMSEGSSQFFFKFFYKFYNFLKKNLQLI